MTTGKALCLNMIVKNEVANLGRCLASVADHIACWVITDTGSTDGTQDFIRSFFAQRGIRGELHTAPFENFAQARNAALQHAYKAALSFDYVLLTDADMELVVEDPEFRTKLTMPGYSVLQRAGISYWNPRLVRRDSGARYHGVTHEYLDIPGGTGRLEGVWYKDHATGSNRVDKFERDIRLLLKGLEEEPENRRYWFYLAQSYRDAQRTREAADTYAKRADMGGWEEEAWYARYQEARCRRALGDEAGFLSRALAAFNQRPQRAEPLYDLARYYRERGMHEASALFGEAGLVLPRPDNDVLFIDDFVYTAGFQEEYSVAAHYLNDPVRRDRGFAACNWLALNRTIPEGTRDLARLNLRFYLAALSTLIPSFQAQRLDLAIPEGYQAGAPSVARHGERIVAVQPFEAAASTFTPGSAAAQNVLVRLDDDLAVRESIAIEPPAEMPVPFDRQPGGFREMRPFAWRGDLWVRARMSDPIPAGAPANGIARIDLSAGLSCRLEAWRPLPDAAAPPDEGSWVPLVGADRLEFIASFDPTLLLDGEGRPLAESTPAIAADQFRGASQAVRFGVGWLVLVRERVQGFAEGEWLHQHRFVWLDEACVLRGVSRPFFFHRRAAEVANGLAWHPDRKRLLVSFGSGDGEAWIAAVDGDEVRRTLQDCADLPSAKLGSSAAPGPAAGDVNPAADPSAPAAEASELGVAEPVTATAVPKVLLGIVATQKEALLSFYLLCIEALDYPKEAIILCIRSSTDAPLSTAILNEWIGRVGHLYAAVEFEIDAGVSGPGESRTQGWDPDQFEALARVRHQCMSRALAHDCAFFFIADIDNFVRPQTLRELVGANLPIVAPLLRHVDANSHLSTFHDRVGSSGYFAPSPHHEELLKQQFRGLHQVALVRGTYLVRREAVEHLTYADGSGRHPYVIFAESARQNGIAQYVDNRQLYGYLCTDDKPDAVIDLIAREVSSGLIAAQRTAATKRRSALRSGAHGVAALDRRVPPAIFIHANWRASSTWFWSKFRRFADTMCYFEPFNDLLCGLRRDQALAWDYKWWDSGHSPSTPYCLEYMPLIRRRGGVRLFGSRIPYAWFIPQGGLRGELRQEERRYLALLIRHAERAGSAPVFGFTNSLGRIWPIKNTFGGLHLFQYRSLWKQWQSYISYKRRNTTFFYETVPRLVNRTDDPFFSELRAVYLKRTQAATDALENGGQLPVGDAAANAMLELPEADIFAMFMGMHVYLYLHAQLTADLSVDVTRMGREPDYRAQIEEMLGELTNLPLSFPDVGDDRRARSPRFNLPAIDWQEIRDHAHRAVQALAAYGDPGQLEETAAQFIDTTIADMEASRPSARPVKVASAVRKTAPREPVR